MSEQAWALLLLNVGLCNLFSVYLWKKVYKIEEKVNTLEGNKNA